MKTLITLVFLIIFALPVSAAPAAAAPDETGDLALEVFQMTRSLEELVQLLKEQKARQGSETELQRLEIAVSYLSFRHRRIEGREQELQEMRLARERLEEIVAKIEAEPEAWNRLQRHWAREAPLSPAFDERPENFKLKLFRERIEGLDGRISALETEIGALRGELTELEDFVQRKLDLLR